jgi:carboxyl-terminal processing protease
MMRHPGPLGLIASVGLATALLPVGCATLTKEPALTEQERRLNVESFDCVWTKVNDEYWDPQFGGVDWPEVRDELRPRIERASSLAAARGILREMIARLGLSHFAIIPAEVYKDLEQPTRERPPDGDTGIDLRVLDAHALVTSVVPGSPADRLGVQPGWEVVRIGQLDVVDRLTRLARELGEDLSKPCRLAYAVIPHLMGPVGASVSATFVDGDGQTVKLDIPLAERRERVSRVGNLGEIGVWIDVKTIDENIGYIAFSGFFNPPYLMKAFNDAMRSFREADGIIIDLRGNGGGLGAMAMGMAGWLVSERHSLGTLRLRDTEMKLLVQPRATRYAGPAAVLVDGLSGSASEFFAGGLQEMGRVCVVGSRTKGEALPGQFTTLPNGDVFLYATANFVSAGGKTLEGVGVTPDIEVALTRPTLLAGRDPVLKAAIAWIRGQSRPGGSGK